MQAFNAVHAVADRSIAAHKRVMACLNALKEQILEDSSGATFAEGHESDIHMAGGICAPVNAKAKPTRQEEATTARLLNAQRGKKGNPAVAAPKEKATGAVERKCSACKLWGVISTSHTCSQCTFPNSAMQSVRVPPSHAQGKQYEVEVPWQKSALQINFDGLQPPVNVGEHVVILSNGHMCHHTEVPRRYTNKINEVLSGGAVLKNVTSKESKKRDRDKATAFAVGDSVSVWWPDYNGWFRGEVDKVTADIVGVHYHDEDTFTDHAPDEWEIVKESAGKHKKASK